MPPTPDVDDFHATLRRQDCVFEVDRSKGVIATFTRYCGRDLEFATVIKTTPDHFLAHLDHWGPRDVDEHVADPREAAYRILLVNIDDEFLTLKGNPDLIQIGPKDLRAFRSRAPVDPLGSLPPGDYEWRDGPATI